MKKHRIVFIIGLLLLCYAPIGNVVALPGFMRFLARGGTSEAGNTFDIDVLIGAIKTIFWMYSLPLGTTLIVLGLAMKAEVKKSKLVIFFIFSLIYTGFVSIPHMPKPPGYFFGIFGTTILVSFVFAAVNWYKKRIISQNTTALDFQMLSIICYTIAAWYVCGLGSIGKILHPDEMIQLNTFDYIPALVVKIMISFVLGTLFSALSLSKKE